MTKTGIWMGILALGFSHYHAFEASGCWRAFNPREEITFGVLGPVEEYVSRLFSGNAGSDPEFASHPLRELNQVFSQMGFNSAQSFEARALLVDIVENLDRTPRVGSRPESFILSNPEIYPQYFQVGQPRSEAGRIQFRFEELFQISEVQGHSLEAQYVRMLMTIAVYPPHKRARVANRLFRSWEIRGNPLPRQMILPVLQLIPANKRFLIGRARVNFYKKWVDRLTWSDEETLVDYALFLSLLPDDWEANLIWITLSKNRPVKARSGVSPLEDYLKSESQTDPNQKRLAQVLARLLKSRTGNPPVTALWEYFTRIDFHLTQYQNTSGELVAALRVFERKSNKDGQVVLADGGLPENLVISLVGAEYWTDADANIRSSVLVQDYLRNFEPVAPLQMNAAQDFLAKWLTRR